MTRTCILQKKTWTEEQSKLADRLLLDYAKQRSNDVSTHADDFADRHEQESRTEIHTVWQKLQTFPHCFEIAERRLELDTLELDGTPRDKKLVAKSIAQLHYLGWSIKLLELNEFRQNSLLSTGLAEFLTRALRCRLSSDERFLRHDLLRSEKLPST